MKLIVHAGTGTIIDADDDVYVIDTNLIDDATLGGYIEDGDEHQIVELAKEKGRRINSSELELTYRNTMAFTPSALKYEAEENETVRKTIQEDAKAWLDTASDEAFAKVSEFIMNDDLLWENFSEIIADAIKAVYELDK